MRRRLACLLPLTLLLGCTSAPVAPRAPVPAVARGPGIEPPPAWADEIAESMDTAVDPCTDFYSYACGRWISRAQIPEGYEAWDQGSIAAVARMSERVRAGLVTPPAGSPREVLAAQGFFRACQAGADANGRLSMAPLLARIDAVADLPGLMRAVGYLHSIGVPALFTPMPIPYQGDVLLAFGPGGISFPPGVYVGDAALQKEVQQAYRGYESKLMRNVADPLESSDESALRVFDFETRLARALVLGGEGKSPAPPERMTREQLQQRLPGLPWAEYFDALGLPENVPIGVVRLDFFTALEHEVLIADAALWRRYLRWFAVSSLAPLLDETAVRAWMETPIRVALGMSTQPPPRWLRCVQETESDWPEAVDVLTRTRGDGSLGPFAAELGARVASGLAHGVATSTWMDAGTQAEARRKLTAAAWMLPLPAADRPPPPAPPALESSGPDAFVSLLVATRRARFLWSAAHFDLARRGAVSFMRRTSEPLALYQFASNVVEVSPTLLEAPFLDAERPAAMNFATFGGVVGHELSHSLAGTGRSVDAQLQWRDWWSQQTASSFEHGAQCMSEVYGSYTIAPATTISPQPLRVNGARTLEENFADLSGLAAAYAAFTAWQLENAPVADAIPGLSDEQLFFLAYGQLWCQQVSPGGQFFSAYLDTHAPARFRVNGPLSQFPPFARAFSCPFASPMVGKPQCGLMSP